MFDIDPFLVKAAAAASQDLDDTQSIDYRDLVSRLSRSESVEFLTRLAEGDSGVRLSLRKRLNEFLPKESIRATQPRTLQKLLKQAKQLEQADKERQAKETRQRHIAEMKALALKEPQVWKQVDDLLANGRKTASVYDEATGLLEKLKQLADFQDTRALFLSRVNSLANKYASRPSLIDRWKKRGWL